MSGKIEKYVCQCCGGRIDRISMTCEYCGTRYKEAYADIIRIETFQNPIETLRAEVVLDRYELEALGSHAGEYVRHRISERIADALADLTKYDCEFDMNSRFYRVRGITKVVIPKDKGTPFFGREVET